MSEGRGAKKIPSVKPPMLSRRQTGDTMSDGPEGVDTCQICQQRHKWPADPREIKNQELSTQELLLQERSSILCACLENDRDANDGLFAWDKLLIVPSSAQVEHIGFYRARNLVYFDQFVELLSILARRLDNDSFFFRI